MAATYNEESVYDGVEFAHDAKFDDMKTTTQLGREFMAAFSTWAKGFSAQKDANDTVTFETVSLLSNDRHDSPDQTIRTAI